MELNDKLTNLQRIALRGEIAYALSTCAHDAEMKYRIYVILKEVEEKYKPFLIQEFKDSTNFDEVVIDKIYLETLTNKVPVWLWIEKVIEDIKTALALVPAKDQGALISIDKLEERRKVIESAFISFARKALMICPDASEQLFNEMLKDIDLEFLHTTCFYLRNCCDEVRDLGYTHDKTKDAILDCQFDIRDLLSLRVESDTLEVVSKKRNLKKPKPKKKKPPMEVIEINGSISQAELSEYISEKIAELFKNVVSTETDTEEIKYIVKKVYKGTDITTDIRTCETKEEAEEFIEKVKKAHPDLQNSCEFIVCRTKKNGKKD